MVPQRFLGVALLLLFLSSVATTRASQATDPVQCLEACQSTTSNVTIPICTSVLHTTWDFLYGTGDCLFDCNITAIHIGQCGCPNNCSSDRGNGICLQQQQPTCRCYSPWGGPDCSTLIACGPDPRQVCSNHGVCRMSEEADVDPVGLCTCDAGWVGPYCETPRASYLSTPAFPSQFPNEAPYQPHDEYHDQHPVFNVTTVATIRLTVSDWEYEYMVSPSNIRNASKVSAHMVFDNGVISKTFSSIGLSLKGASSRKNLKKGWNLRFDYFDPDQKLLDIPRMGLKASTDPSMMRNIVAMDLGRSMGLQFQRIGFTQLWINGVYHGFYIMSEEITKQYLKSRFPETSTHGLIKCHRAHLLDNGDFPANYSANDYKVEFGKTSRVMEGLIKLIKAVNNPDDIAFVEETGAIFNLNHFLRYMVIETSLGNPDSYTWRGNNWFLYTDFDTEQSLYVPYDQEESFGEGMRFNSTQWQQMSPTDFFSCEKWPGVDCGAHPLSSKLFRLFYDEFETLLHQFMKNVWTLSMGRVKGLGKLFAQQLQYDQWYGIDAETPKNVQTFLHETIPNFLNYLNGRLHYNG